MAAELLISASNLNNQKVGEIVDTQEGGHVWGNREQPPNYVHLTITDATREQVYNFLENWHIKFQHEIQVDNPNGYRILVSVDPAYISASDIGKDRMKSEMETWAVEEYNCTNIVFSSASMRVDVPKPVDLQKMKSDFADIFDEVLDMRRYKFSEADVSTALANGGKMTLTKQQALNNIIDKLDL
jgi:hypothetical protein